MSRYGYGASDEQVDWEREESRAPGLPDWRDDYDPPSPQELAEEQHEQAQVERARRRNYEEKSA